MTPAPVRSGQDRLKLGAALYAGWVALVITGIVGGIGLAFQQPWLFPSLGPTIFIHTVTPNQEAARPWNTFVGHVITLGGFRANFATVVVLVVGIGLATFLCDWGRRIVTYEFRRLP